MSIDLIPADSLHWPLLRALTQLPVPGDMPSVSGWLAMLSTADGSQRPVGAGLVRIAGRESAAWLAVAPAWRRQGVARQLSQVAARHAAAQGAARIVSWQGVTEPTGQGLCAHLGMRVANTLSYFETTLANAEKFFGHFNQRMLARGRVPTDLQVLHGNAVPWRHFDALLVQEFGAAMAARLGRIAGYGLARNEWASALMDKGRPVAVTLCSVLDDCVSHDAYLVMPEYRLLVRSIIVDTYQATPRSNLFQRDTTGEALNSSMPWRMRVLSSSMELTRMWRRNVRAILENAHSIDRKSVV